MSRDQSVLGADHGGADECEQAAGRAVQHGDEDQDESRTRHQRQRRECQVGVAPAEPLPQRRGERGTHHGDGGRAKHATWGHHQARAPPLQQPSRSDAGHGTGEAARGERPCDRRWRPAGVRGDSRCEHSEGVVEDAIADRDTRTERHESPSSSPGREQATAPGRSSRSPLSALSKTLAPCPSILASGARLPSIHSAPVASSSPTEVLSISSDQAAASPPGARVVGFRAPARRIGPMTTDSVHRSCDRAQRLRTAFPEAPRA